MAHKLVVVIPDQDPIEHPLTEGRVTLGSHASSAICVNYENEVDAEAAVIEVRGEAVFLQNLNQFPIYIGQRELAAAATTEWPPYDQVFLTRSVALRLVNDEDDDEQTVSVAQGSRSTMQIAVTLMCLGLCYYLLTSDSSAPKTAATLEFGFDTLVAKLEDEAPANSNVLASQGDDSRIPRNLSKLPFERQTILSYLTDAGRADARWGRTRIDPERAISAYELLLGCGPIRGAPDDGDSVESQIKAYATARVLDLAASVN